MNAHTMARLSTMLLSPDLLPAQEWSAGQLDHWVVMRLSVNVLRVGSATARGRYDAVGSRRVIDKSAWWGRHRCRFVVYEYSRSTSSCRKDLLDTSDGGIQSSENRHDSVAHSELLCMLLSLPPTCCVLFRKLQAISGNRRFRPPSPHRHTRKKVHPSPSKANNIPPTNHIPTHNNDKIPPLHRPPRRQRKANRRRHIDDNRF